MACVPLRKTHYARVLLLDKRYCHVRRRSFHIKGLFEASALKTLFGLDLDGLKGLIDRFGAADVSRNGSLEMDELCVDHTPYRFYTAQGKQRLRCV